MGGPEAAISQRASQLLLRPDRPSDDKIADGLLAKLLHDFHRQSRAFTVRPSGPR
jgi:hypothetical protein